MKVNFLLQKNKLIQTCSFNIKQLNIKQDLLQLNSIFIKYKLIKIFFYISIQFLQLFKMLNIVCIISLNKFLLKENIRISF